MSAPVQIAVKRFNSVACVSFEPVIGMESRVWSRDRTIHKSFECKCLRILRPVVVELRCWKLLLPFGTARLPDLAAK